LAASRKWMTKRNFRPGSQEFFEKMPASGRSDALSERSKSLVRCGSLASLVVIRATVLGTTSNFGFRAVVAFAVVPRVDESMKRELNPLSTDAVRFP